MLFENSTDTDSACLVRLPNLEVGLFMLEPSGQHVRIIVLVAKRHFKQALNPARFFWKENVTCGCIVMKVIE
jgi:hypothetical protein